MEEWQFNKSEHMLERIEALLKEQTKLLREILHEVRELAPEQEMYLPTTAVVVDRGVSSGKA